MSNLHRGVNGTLFFDVCGHLDMQLVAASKLFSCASRGEFARFVPGVTAVEGMKCPLIGVTVYSTTF